MSRTDDKGPVATAYDGEAIARELEGERESVNPVSGVRPILRSSAGGICLPDENERTRMIADITRLIGEPAMPETTRLAGLTLIGWLARRRPEEAPHTVGIDEARESERRVRAARAKAR